ncbi:MAG: hypothetical protein NDP19_05810 [Crenarchaeota archaeon]|nr:hypothetical protein [Thermoproteota archaeon]
MGMNGRQLAEESFDVEKRISRVLRLYERALSVWGRVRRGVTLDACSR